jgi:hypothetical protein
MTIRAACLAFPTRGRSAENFGRPKCPRCGCILLIAEAARFNAQGHVDHAWSCDDCGNEFVTSVCLPPR